MEEENQTENPSQNVVNPPEPIVQTPEVPTALPSSNSRKYLIWGGIIVLILLLLTSTAYFAYQNMQLKNQVAQPTPVTVTSPTPSPATTTDETANWKTYKSNACNFTLKYPSGWTAKAFSVTSDGSCAFLTASNYSEGLDSSTGMFMGIYTSNYASVNEVIDSMTNMSSPPAPPSNIQTVTFGQYKGKYFETHLAAETSFFVFEKDGRIYQTNWPLELNTQYKNTVEKIIGSINFTQ